MKSGAYRTGFFFFFWRVFNDLSSAIAGKDKMQASSLLSHVIEVSCYMYTFRFSF